MFYFMPIAQQLHMLDQWINEADRSLADKPAGSLFLQPCHGTIQYYFREEASSTRYTRYIRKDEKALIHDLIQKDYDRKFLRLAYKIQKQLESLQKREISRSASFMYRPLGAIYDELSPARKEHVSPYVLPDSLYIENWLAAPYDKLHFAPEQSEIITENGERVRSKSEKILADKYALMGIPYLYEKPVKLLDLGTVHPDFTLLDINERTTVLHEHFGMMHDAEYREKAMYKIDCYERSGYFPGSDFLITFEGSDHVLNTKAFDQMLRSRFLSCS